MSEAGLDFQRRITRSASGRRLFRLHLDAVLLGLLLMVLGYGLVVLYSAMDRSSTGVTGQAVRIGVALAVLFVAAQVSPRLYHRWAFVAYGGGVLLLGLVLVMGSESKGATRWLDLPGLPRFQPSEIMKIAVPLMVAAYLADRAAPPRPKHLFFALVMIAVPAGFVFVQPDLGTAIMITASGLAVVVLAGIRWRWVLGAGLAAVLLAPLSWFVLKDYQKSRILTLFDPERDPLGAGWNIIQAKTAIGSGGLTGKGLFEGTQSHLDFLPESHTDFIIAVLAEELGLIGVSVLLLLYLLVVARGLFIAIQARDAFGRYVAGALTMTFFVYVFVNIAMVSGLLPVVGVPLPLVSHGGTSMLTLLGGFGIIMSIHTHQRGRVFN